MALPPVISSIGDYSIGAVSLIEARSTGAISSSAGTANRAVFVPLQVPSSYTVRMLWWFNGTSVTGNVDAGIYALDGTRLVSTGSTAQSGTSVVQSVTLGSPYSLAAGSYYLAVSRSSTGHLFRSSAIPAGGTAELKLYGVAAQDTAFPLPSSATLAAASVTPPIFGIGSRTLI